MSIDYISIIENKMKVDTHNRYISSVGLEYMYKSGEYDKKTIDYVVELICGEYFSTIIEEV